jgi:broad specificity phosphatase PhoE
MHPDSTAHPDRTALLVVRHGRAGSRRRWEGPDVERPLSGRGQKQALALVDQLQPYAPKRILTSPFVRCVQTVEPLAREVGLAVETTDALAEGASPGTVSALVADVRGSTAVLCTHGDVIGVLLDVLVGADGIDLPDELPCAKGSTWVLDEHAGRYAGARYLAPPG